MGEPEATDDQAPQVRTVVIDQESLVRVRGTLDSHADNRVVVDAIHAAMAAGAIEVVLDLAEVDFAGVELVTALAATSALADGVIVVRPPKTMLLAVDALRMRGRLDLRDEPSR